MESEFVEFAIDKWYIVTISIVVLAVIITFTCKPNTPKSNKKNNKKKVDDKPNNNNNNTTKRKNVNDNKNTTGTASTPTTDATSPSIMGESTSKLIEKVVKAMTINGNEITGCAVSGNNIAYCCKERFIKIFNYHSMLSTSHNAVKSYNIALPIDYALCIVWQGNDIFAFTYDKFISYTVTEEKQQDGKTYIMRWCHPVQHKHPILSIDASSSTTSANFIVSLDNSAINLWDTQGKMLASKPTGQMKNFMVAISRSGRFFGAATSGSELRIWENTLKRDGSFDKCSKGILLTGYTSSIYCFAFGHNDAVLTGGKDGQIKLWDLNVRYHSGEDAKLVYTIASGLPTPPTIIKFSPSGASYVVGCSTLLQFRQTDTGRLLNQIDIASVTTDEFKSSHITWAPNFESEKPIIAADHHFYLLKNVKNAL